MAKKVAVLIKEKERQYEGLRTSLGLLMEFHIVSMIVLNHEIELTEEYKDNMEFIDEMEGTRYSNVPGEWTLFAGTFATPDIDHFECYLQIVHWDARVCTTSTTALSRFPLHKEFLDLADADICTTLVHVLARKS